MRNSVVVLMLINLKVFSLIAQENVSSNKIKVTKAKSSVAVELLKMNVLYVGVDNPVNIAVAQTRSLLLL